MEDKRLMITSTKTPFWLAFALAFCSGNFYREVVAKWRWRALFHLMLFIILAWIPVIVVQSFRVDALLNDMTNQLPVITIKNGQATVDQNNKTYFIRDVNSDRIILLVNMQGDKKTLSEKKMKK